MRNGRTVRSPCALPPPAPTQDISAEVAVLRELLETMRTANDDLRAERDRWHALAIRPWWKRLAG
ncbi:hypothetical protein H7Q97_13070 [Ochrobactrum sp. CM-21-5]|nr:hypothetical protein [Ochrobactrum sp. CM-21-5]MBC2886323.1 hypothetical protein [Ochrobactrum sp. CM-21-5]